MKIINIEENYRRSLEITAKIIQSGGLVVFPSDTVYGLLVDATNQKAVDKLLAFKDRWPGKAISVAVKDKEMAKIYVEFNENIENIYDKLLPGPFTIIGKGRNKLASGIEAENGTLGVRIPKFIPILDLSALIGKPVTVTSANLSGRSPHYTIASFLNTLSTKKKGMIDLVVDGGKLPKNKPSTVIDATESELKILRRGDLITGKKENLISKSEKETSNIATFLLEKWVDKDEGGPIVLGLSGDLGCGKTVFARSLGKYLGVKGRITSPTFVIYNEYQINWGRFTRFLHFDLYRISEFYELEEIKFWDLADEETIACIEWPENMGEEAFLRLKEKVRYLQVNFTYIDQTIREISY